VNTISVDALPRTLAQREAAELSEFQHQSRLIRWADEMAASGLRPELEMLFAIPNGMWTTPAQAGKAKATGLRSGVPDLCLPIPRGGYVALWIEMKSERGRLSVEQDQWHKRLVANGSLVAICFSHHQAAQTLVEYLDGQFVRP
jgi:hypothetical protein